MKGKINHFSLKIQEAAIFNNFQKGLWKNTTRVKYTNFTNYALKRQFEKISVLGIAALEEEESNQVRKHSILILIKNRPFLILLCH